MSVKYLVYTINFHREGTRDRVEIRKGNVIDPIARSPHTFGSKVNGGQWARNFIDNMNEAGPRTTPLGPDDPARWMLKDGVESTPTVHDDNCYICMDPEMAMMGLPLCTACAECGSHVAADDSECKACGYDYMDEVEGGPNGTKP